MTPLIVLGVTGAVAAVIRVILVRRSVNPAYRCPQCNRPMRVSYRHGGATAYRCPKRGHHNFRIEGRGK